MAPCPGDRVEHAFFSPLPAAAGVFLAVCLLAMPVPAASFVIPGGGGDFHLKTRTFQDAKFKDTVRQKYDFSCGSAALATLLTYHYGRPAPEKAVLDAMYAVGDQEKIRKEGFSLLDMKKYLASIGLKAEGYRESLDKLRKVGVPAIVLTNTKGYLHFVVIKGISNDEVMLGDPALGMRFMPRKDFERGWNKVLFVVTDEMQTARRSFDKRLNRNIARHFGAPLLANDLGSFTVSTIPTPGYY